MEKIAVDDQFYNLMNIGFERRNTNDMTASLIRDEGLAKSPSFAAFIRIAAMETADQLELRKTKGEQLKELKKKKMMQRSGVMKLIPQSWAKYVDYLVSLRENPTKRELLKNMAVAGIFSFVVSNNARVRMAALYTLIGNMMIVSILLTRNMPKVDVPMGMDKNKVINWSKSAFNTALGVTFLGAISGGLLFALMAHLFTPFELIMKVESTILYTIRLGR